MWSWMALTILKLELINQHCIKQKNPLYSEAFLDGKAWQVYLFIKIVRASSVSLQVLRKARFWTAALRVFWE